ncbi:MAG TPA: hypothetical protein VFI47_14910 [Acidimicrobiales bacterium]|nr:hypothetical protein [Acidimicrobiales bacterium]
MWFAHFRRRRAPDDPEERCGRPEAWQDSDLGEEVAAFLAGRSVPYYIARGQPVPAWAVLNRLAHADRAELVRLVEGNQPDDGSPHPATPRVVWATAERFMAGHLLARAATADELRAIQLLSLVPVELRLLERGKVDRITADQVLEAGAEALDTSLPGT